VSGKGPSASLRDGQRGGTRHRAAFELRAGGGPPAQPLYEFPENRPASQVRLRRRRRGNHGAGHRLGISTWQFVQKNRAYQRASAAEQEQSRSRQIAETKEKQSQHVAQFLKDMLASVEPSRALGRDVTMLREILDKTAERVGKDLKEQPEVERSAKHAG